MIFMMERKVKVLRMELRSKIPNKLMITMNPRKMPLLQKRLNQLKQMLKLKIKKNG